jgi:hypothetical protein
MGDKPGKYWDYEKCAWVRCPTGDDVATGARADAVIPAQPDLGASAPVASDAEADVRSG